MDIVKLAEEIAREAHKGQTRNDNVTPYIVHPERVARSFTNNPDAQAVAWLHDVIEDIEMTEDDLLKKGIPKHITEAVELLTRDKSVEYMVYINAIKRNTYARKVKIQDIEDNLNDNPRKGKIPIYRQVKEILEREEKASLYFEKLTKSVTENVADEIEGLGVTEVTIAYSKLGGLGRTNYQELMGKPAKLASVLEIFKGMRFHCARITLENNWVLCIDAYQGFTKLEK